MQTFSCCRLVLMALGLLAVGELSAQEPRNAAQVETINQAVIEAAQSAALRRGQCPELPALAGQNVDEIMPTLNPRLFRPQVRVDPSSRPARTILREPTLTLMEGRVCAIEFVVSDGSLVIVPNLLRVMLADGEAHLAEAGLRSRVSETPSEQPVGTVVAQDPLPESEVPRGSVVTLTVAVANLYELPNLIGQSLRETRPILRPFAVRVNAVAGLQPRGEITGQAPAGPSRQPRGTEVVLEVSDGSLVEVPPVERRPIDVARGALEGVGLVADTSAREDLSAPGTVVSQEPQARKVVRRGSAVRLVASTGIAVPEVVGRTIEAARTLLARFEVRERIVPSGAPRGEVVGQEPEPGRRVEAGSRVDVAVSDGSWVVVPALEGEMIDVARARTEAVGLAIEAAPKADTREPGTVLSQQPSAGAVVARDTTVHVGVATAFHWPLWAWLLGGLAALTAGVPLARWLLRVIRPPVSYQVRLETEPESVRVGELAEDGPALRIAARLETGESTVWFDGDSP